jgi:hypothetical protein
LFQGKTPIKKPEETPIKKPPIKKPEETPIKKTPIKKPQGNTNQSPKIIST